MNSENKLISSKSETRQAFPLKYLRTINIVGQINANSSFKFAGQLFGVTEVFHSDNCSRYFHNRDCTRGQEEGEVMREDYNHLILLQTTLHMIEWWWKEKMGEELTRTQQY